MVVDYPVQLELLLYAVDRIHENVRHLCSIARARSRVVLTIELPYRFSSAMPYSIACSLSVFVLHRSLYDARGLSVIVYRLTTKFDDQTVSQVQGPRN